MITCSNGYRKPIAASESTVDGVGIEGLNKRAPSRAQQTPLTIGGASAFKVARSCAMIA
ncbi:hypothetical protein [Halomonas citrativorans]|uniref:hypothetical protein n=1 Tax=Halomonas citrativorans TaxID=2742612 RepID=UPI0015947515|nr:hypothetical protein [Halomonas citrativorans]